MCVPEHVNHIPPHLSHNHNQEGGGGGGGREQGLGARNHVIETCKAIRKAAALRKGGKIFRSN